MSRSYTIRVKSDGALPTGERIIDAIVQRIAEVKPEYPVLDEVLGPDVVLVPMPGSAPLLPGGLWVPQRICDRLVAHRLGEAVYPIVKRTRAVPKSTLAQPGARPNPPDHYESVALDDRPFPTFRRITLVDDVITRGSKFVGVMPRLQAAYPNAEIRCFALIRTVSDGEIDAFRQPVSGIIQYAGGHLHRVP